MRGDLILSKSTITDITKFAYANIVGAKIVGTKKVKNAVKQRETAKSVRVSVSAHTVDAVGVGPIRFVMSVDRVAGGGKVYTMVPADGKPAHGEIRARA